jgi:nitrile hydratase accessory protein
VTVFEAPWEAKAFALAVALRDADRLSWPAFQDRLAARIAADPGEHHGYYEHWLAALEDVIGDAVLAPGSGPGTP